MKLVDPAISGVYFCHKCGSDLRIAVFSPTTRKIVIVEGKVFVMLRCDVCGDKDPMKDAI